MPCKEATEVSIEKDPWLVLLDGQIKQLSKLDDTYMACRIGAVGHNWRAVQPDWKPPAGVTAMAKQCTHCTTIVRMNVSTRYGEVLSSPRYEYPDGYQIPSGTNGEHIRSQAVRATWARKLREQVLPEIRPHFEVTE
jgi:hypothetical protein